MLTGSFIRISCTRSLQPSDCSSLRHRPFVVCRIFYTVYCHLCFAHKSWISVHQPSSRSTNHIRSTHSLHSHILASRQQGRFRTSLLRPPLNNPSMALSPSLKSPTDYTPVSPANFVDGSRRTPQIGYSIEKKETGATTRSVRTNSSSSSSPSLNTPRKARFAEATSVNSPMAEPNEHRLPFSRSKMSETTAKPSDVGFGYISDNNPVEQHATLGSNTTGPASPPLRSALKTPGTSTRFLHPLSPTFREEAMLEKQELSTDKQQAKDLVSTNFAAKCMNFDTD